MRLLFLGTSQFAGPSLEALLASAHQVLALVTQPDRPQGRGRKIASPPVKSMACKRGIPVLQPEKVRDPSFLAMVQSLHPELVVVVAYGQILPPAVLSLPWRGCVNLHGSLLPKYRGAAPIARAILAGETRTGVTTMLMDSGMDTGPILLAEEIQIQETDTAGTLQDRLSRSGAGLLLQALEGLERGTIKPQPQDHSQATYAPKVTREEGLIRWDSPARELSNRLRAFDPWPGAFTFWNGRLLKLFRPRLVEISEVREPPGTVIEASADHLSIATSNGGLVISEVQPENRPRMAVPDFLRGYPLRIGARLGA